MIWALSHKTYKMVKYPIGIQSFPDIIENGYLYVDKTKLIHEMITTGKYYFLSRPRRFGKSLLLSTIEAVFNGKKDLFKGLYISKTNWDWNEYEVIHIDLNGENYQGVDTLKAVINGILSQFENKYNIAAPADTFGLRFREIIKTASETSGRNVVILIDEYDKPILDTINDKRASEANRDTLQAFYSVLKSMDQYIKFAILTGISKFSKVSVFSGLNNLNDISLSSNFNAVCGVSESELTQYFSEGIKDLARCQSQYEEEIRCQLKNNYDGYLFSRKGEGIYNPFSLLNCFSKNEFGDYWFATGTPSSLIRLIEKSNFPIPELEQYECSESMLNGTDIYLTDPIPLLFQAGYLTIKGYDNRFKLFTLGFPNSEVAEGFSTLLLSSYSGELNQSAFLKQFVEDVEKGYAEAFMKKLQSFFAGIPYDHIYGNKKKTEDKKEAIKGYIEVHFQNVMFVIMKLMGFYTHTEYRTSNGRIDMTIETTRYVYVMEFKINSSAKDALNQIETKEYSLPFKYQGKGIIKIGANFDTKTRTLSDFLVSRV